MPQFPKRRTQPTTPETYLRWAQELQERADRIRACAHQRGAREKSAVTRHLYRISVETSEWLKRHHATVDGTLMMPPKK